MRDCGERLDVVDRGRLSEHARYRWERRLDSRIASLSFEGVHHRGLLAADVGPGSLVHVHVDRLAGSHGIRAEDARRVRLLQGRLDTYNGLGELAADVDVAGLRADRIRPDRTALDERVRRPSHDFPVLERARLGLVGVTAEVVWFSIADLHERPFHPCRETGAAAPAKPRILDQRDNVTGLHLEGLIKRGITAALLPAIERRRVPLAKVLGEQRRLARV